MTGRGRDIAIIGMAGRFPLAPDIATLWRRLTAGEDCVHAGLGRSPHLTPGRPPRGGGTGTPAGFLDGFDQFDAGFFGVGPLEARITDPQHRLLLETAWEALEDAGYGRTDGLRVGVFATASQSGYQWTNVRANAAVLEATDETQLALGNAPDFLATRVSFKLDLRGPSVTVTAACASSLVAVHLAGLSLLAGECDLAVVGGASITVSPWCSREPDGGLAPPSSADRCRSFSADAQHTVAGDGVVALVLRPLQAAVEARDPVRAVVKGTAVNNDGGHKMGFSTPGVDGQVEVVREALAVAGVAAASVGYVEGHGSGTPIGDSIELTALTEAYGPYPAGQRLLGSVKSNIGYLDGTAGLAGLVKTVLSFDHELIPANLHFTAAHPNHDAFTVVGAPTAWPRARTPRRAGVGSYAMGGTNAHAILEEAPATHRGGEVRRAHAVLTVSARTRTAVDAAAERLAAYLTEVGAGVGAGANGRARAGGGDLADVGFTLHVGRRAFAHRRSLVLEVGAGNGVHELGPQPAVWSPAVDSTAAVPGVVFGFPRLPPGGDAAAGLYRREPAFACALDACGSVLRDRHGLALPLDGGQSAPDDAAAFAFWYAMCRMWAAWGVNPAAAIGSSTGDGGRQVDPPARDVWRLAVAASAGLLDLDEALRLVVGPESTAGTGPESTAGTGLESEDIAGAILVDLGSCLDERGLAEAVARVWTHGIDLNWSEYHAEEQRCRVPLPTYPFERTRYWVDPDPLPEPGRDRFAEEVSDAGTAASQLQRWAEDLDRMLSEGVDPVEVTVAGVWQEVLGVPAVGAQDDFFALGGDSLRLLRATGRLRELFGMEIPLAEAFTARRMHQLIALLEDLAGREAAR